MPTRDELERQTARGDRASAERLLRDARRRDDLDGQLLAACILGDFTLARRFIHDCCARKAFDRLASAAPVLGLRVEPTDCARLSARLARVEGPRSVRCLTLADVLCAALTARHLDSGVALIDGGEARWGRGGSTICLAVRLPEPDLGDVVVGISQAIASNPAPNVSPDWEHEFEGQRFRGDPGTLRACHAWASARTRALDDRVQLSGRPLAELSDLAAEAGTADALADPASSTALRKLEAVARRLDPEQRWHGVLAQAAVAFDLEGRGGKHADLDALHADDELRQVLWLERATEIADALDPRIVRLASEHHCWSDIASLGHHEPEPLRYLDDTRRGFAHVRHLELSPSAPGFERIYDSVRMTGLCSLTLRRTLSSEVIAKLRRAPWSPQLRALRIEHVPPTALRALASWLESLPHLELLGLDQVRTDKLRLDGLADRPLHTLELGARQPGTLAAALDDLAHPLRALVVDLPPEGADQRVRLGRLASHAALADLERLTLPVPRMRWPVRPLTTALDADAIDALTPALARLRDLTLTVDAPGALARLLGDVDVPPPLTRLVVHTRPEDGDLALDGADLDALATRLPSLEILELHRFELDAAGLTALTSGGGLRRLRRLALRRVRLDTTAVRQFTDSADLPALEELDLLDSKLTRAGVESLTRWPGFARLRALFIRPQGKATDALLEAAAPRPDDLYIGR